MAKINIPVSFDNVISGRIFDCEWRDMTKEERENNLQKIKNVLSAECRGNNTEIAKAIRRMSLTNLPNNIGIYRRLTVEGYTAGQSYSDEMRYIKDTIKRQC